jgi:hypothetical protein
MHKEPNTSVHPKGTFNQATATTVADKGSAHAYKLVRCGPICLTANK